MEGQSRTTRAGRRTRISRRLTATAAVMTGALVALPLAANAALPAAGSPPVTTTSGPGAHATPTGPPITLSNGHSITPTLGDWEGTVDGLPASFNLTRDPRPQGSHEAAYGINALVVITPSRCPVGTAHVHEVELQTTTGPIRLRSGGALGLGHVGFGGKLTGARTATLNRAFHLAGCHGSQTWDMHPALRLPVTDGRWAIRFGGGPAAHITVIDGGRLAAGLPLTRQLGLCEGLTGAVDLFIGPRGTATTTDPELRAHLHFAKDRATGSISTAGPGCRAHKLSVTAKLLSAPAKGKKQSGKDTGKK